MSDDRTSIIEAGYTEEELAPEYSLAQKGLSEFVGAFTLIFVAAGSIIAANYAGGGVSGAGLVTIAIAHGLAIATMVTAIGHISGGHLNPAVTIAAFVTRKITAVDAGGYIVAQIAGAIAAAGLLRAAVDEAVWEAVDLGTPLLGDGVSAGQGVLIEAVLTFFLVWVVFATAIDPRGAFGKVAGLAIGFVILMDVMMGGPFTGAAMNPARAFGPALAGGVWDDHWVYWLGPVAGGVIAAVLYDALQMTPMGRGRRPDRRD